MKLEKDTRTEERRRLDEKIAAEPPKPRPPKINPATTKPIEEFLGPEDLPKARAVIGIVEKGLVRPLDPNHRLPEQHKVLIVGQW